VRPAQASGAAERNEMESGRGVVERESARTYEAKQPWVVTPRWPVMWVQYCVWDSGPVQSGQVPQGWRGWTMVSGYDGGIYQELQFSASR